MLVLSRKISEKLIIDGGITIQVVEIKGNRVRLGIEAPPHVEIFREELRAMSNFQAVHRTPAELVS